MTVIDAFIKITVDFLVDFYASTIASTAIVKRSS